jgi:hypothetical protein
MPVRAATLHVGRAPSSYFAMLVLFTNVAPSKRDDRVNRAAYRDPDSSSVIPLRTARILLHNVDSLQ